MSKFINNSMSFKWIIHLELPGQAAHFSEFQDTHPVTRGASRFLCLGGFTGMSSEPTWDKQRSHAVPRSHPHHATSSCSSDLPPTCGQQQSSWLDQEAHGSRDVGALHVRLVTGQCNTCNSTNKVSSVQAASFSVLYSEATIQCFSQAVQTGLHFCEDHPT